MHNPSFISIEIQHRQTSGERGHERMTNLMQMFIPFLSLRAFPLLLSCFLLPSTVLSQKETDKLYFADSVNVRVNNIAIDGEFALRGLSADFPYPILSTITVVDRKGDRFLALPIH